MKSSPEVLITATAAYSATEVTTVYLENRRIIMKRLYLTVWILSVALVDLSVYCQGAGFKLIAESWPEADRMFHKDPGWLGSDDAYSIDLGDGRVFWLFGDTFIATGDSNVRSESRTIRNSVAIQEGYDPASASITFYWDSIKGNPASFFPDSGWVWYWPGDGTVIDDELLIFLMKIKYTPEGFGFKVLGWSAVLVKNPDKEPNEWRMQFLKCPQNDFDVVVGSASVLRVDDYVYAFSADWLATHHVYLVRWPVSEVVQGNLMCPQWWAGDELGWVVQDRLNDSQLPLFSEAQVEFTVHWDPILEKYVQIQVRGFGATDIAFRWANNLVGPWSEPIPFFRPEESSRSDALVYAAKAHPELLGAELILTYVPSTLGGAPVLNKEPDLYYPKFLKVEYK